MLLASISVFPREPQGEISPLLHGLNLDFCDVNQGIYVGQASDVPHQNGVRLEALRALKVLEPPLLRARNGGANWRDGIGPSRPIRVSTRRGRDEIETNALGTHEFLELCRDVGARAELGVDVAQGTSRELAEWAQYCDFAGQTTLSQERARNGSAAPFGVEFWSIAGDPQALSSDFYAAQYRAFESVFPRFAGQNPQLIASGPDANDAAGAAWTRGLLQGLEKGRAPRLGALDARFPLSNLHNEFGTATEFSLDEYYGLLLQGLKIGAFIDAQREILDASVLGRAASLHIGRWGTEHAPSEDLAAPSGTLRDAIYAAMTLDSLHHRATKVGAAGFEGAVDFGQSLLRTVGETTIRTPTFHVFAAYKGHRGGQLLHAEFESGEAGGLPRLSGSASLRGEIVTLSVVNSGAKSPVEAAISLPGQSIKSVAAKELTGEHLAAQNALDAPESVAPREIAPDFDASNRKSSFVHTFAPASVTVFSIQLGRAEN